MGTSIIPKASDLDQYRDAPGHGRGSGPLDLPAGQRRSALPQPL